MTEDLSSPFSIMRIVQSGEKKWYSVKYNCKIEMTPDQLKLFYWGTRRFSELDGVKEVSANVKQSGDDAGLYDMNITYKVNITPWQLDLFKRSIQKSKDEKDVRDVVATIEEVVQRTLVLIKPDGIEKRLVGKVIARVEELGLTIAQIKRVKMTPEICSQFYPKTKRDLPEIYANVEKIMMGNFSIALIVEGKNAIERVRALRGPTDLLSAEVGTIRRDLITDEERELFRQGKYFSNVMHSPDDRNEAELEMKLLFGEAR